LLNVVWIAILAVASQYNMAPSVLAKWLALGMTFSGGLQAAALWWGLKRAGISLPRKWPRLTSGVKRLIILGVPGLLSAGSTQINLAVNTFVATFENGAASWLYYADRLYQLPLALIGIAMGIALLPTLSRRLRAGDEKGAMNSMNRGMEIAAFLTLPATVALLIIPSFLIGGLLERGEFTALDTENAALALSMFALGLPAFVVLKVLTPAFFARENTRTPMIFAAISAMINLSLGVILFFTIGFYGLALATSLAAWVNVGCLGVVLYREGWFHFDARLKSRLPRIALAAGVMGAVLWAAEPFARGWLDGALITDYLALITMCALGGIAYIIAAFGLRVFNKSDILDAVKKPAADKNL
jgi:putative peptidoglycan lipid II flippase